MNANTHVITPEQEQQLMMNPFPRAIAPHPVLPKRWSSFSRWSRLLAGAAVAVTLFSSAPSAQALVIDEFAESEFTNGLVADSSQNAEMWQCMETCVEQYGEPIKEGGLKLRQRDPASPQPTRKNLVNQCPNDTTLTPFEMPVYDKGGLFVVGHEIIWTCVPDDLQPAG